MKKLPLGIQNFKEIIMGNYIYVDKTQFIYNLISNAKYNFLSRPRRFGKSLLLDTISVVFGGDREIFKGLWIYDSDYNFEKHPVIRLDMSNIANKTPDILEDSLASNILKRIQEENLDINDKIPSDMFKRLIEDLHKKYGQRVVVLIDEYDKPILDHINDTKTAAANRNVVRGFYGILKSMDPHLEFTFITGVSKFTRTSIFSELNNLFDITLNEKYSNICGITTDDLDKYFGEYIKRLSSKKSFLSYDNLHSEILAWYDGYSWDGETRVLNPFSLLSFFMQERFAAFWYASGTPRFLLDLIKKKPESYTNYEKIEMTEYMLDSYDIERIEILPLLFQTGYLTIKEIIFSMDEPIYVLDIPNNEVNRAFNMHIISELTENGEVRTGQMRMGINTALQTGDLTKMLDILRSFFASIPYNLHVDREAYYHSIFYALMSALGFDVDVEVSTSKGKVDAVLELADKIYVMEFKYVKCQPEEKPEIKQKLFEEALNSAIDQINAMGYGNKYSGSGKTIYQAAFAFLGRDEIELRIKN